MTFSAVSMFTTSRQRGLSRLPYNALNPVARGRVKRSADEPHSVLVSLLQQASRPFSALVCGRRFGFEAVLVPAYRVRQQLAMATDTLQAVESPDQQGAASARCTHDDKSCTNVLPEKRAPASKLQAAASC